MKIELKEKNGHLIAEILSDKIEISSTSDALSIMNECFSIESTRIILKEQNFSSSFFDLKTGLAGDILQKFSTYDVRLAIVGDFSKFNSKSLKYFIFESNKHGRINFIASIEEALEKLGK